MQSSYEVAFLSAVILLHQVWGKEEVPGLGGKDNFRIRYPSEANNHWWEGVMSDYITET